MRRSIALATVLVLLGFASRGSAQESSALINKALDGPAKLEIDRETPLPDVMELISSKTGVRIKEDPLIWDLLPWGRDTAVKARFDNVTYRSALELITQKLGLTMALRDEYLEIIPMPALKRLAQRAGRDELRTLFILSTKRLGLEEDHPTVKRLLEVIDTKLAEDKEAQVAVENRVTDAIKQDRTVFVPRNATLMDALESLPKETKATWYPWGKSVMVVTKEESTRRLLAKPLTVPLGEHGADVMQVLMEISRRTGVRFEYQPGVLETVPAEMRTIRGILSNAPVLENVPAQQILEAISAATGLKYSIQDEKVSITSAPAPVAATAPRDPPIGFIQLDIGLQVLVPTSQVPPDLQEYIRFKTQRSLANIRKMMEEENFKPTAQPPTRPTPPTPGQ